MALRDKLIERVGPLLPGEQVNQVFLAQTGANPYLASIIAPIGGLLGGLLFQTLLKRYIIAVTDQSVVVLTATFNGTKPIDVHSRLPRQTKLGPHKGIWGSINLNGQKYYVHAKFRKDIAAADAAQQSAAA